MAESSDTSDWLSDSEQHQQPEYEAEYEAENRQPQPSSSSSVHSIRDTDTKVSEEESEAVLPPVLPESWLKTEKKFTRACEQIMLLSSHIHDIEHRFQMAILQSQPHVYSALESRIEVLEGVRNAYYMYADMKMEQLLDLEQAMTEELLIM